MTFSSRMSSLDILIRPAVHSDVPFVADMFLLSMGSLADHLFAADKQTAKHSIEKLVARNAGRFALRFAWIAEVNGNTKGGLVACKGNMIEHLNLATAPHLFGVMGLSAFGFMWRGVALPGGREAEADEYYIGNLGVHPSAQGLGIGSAMLEFAATQARQHGLAKCSLVAALYNHGAIRLYERFGYEVVETVEHPTLGYYRMVKVL